MDVTLRLARAMKRARLLGDLSQAQVASAVGVHPTYISVLERGLAPNVSLRIVANLARVLDIELSDLAGPGVAKGEKLKITEDESHV